MNLFPFYIIFFCASIINAQKLSISEYVNTYQKIAVQEMHRSGIPASITLAQGILESASGNSKLAKTANNHFGIKCHSDWSGQKIYHDDVCAKDKLATIISSNSFWTCSIGGF